jgi:orotidine-5'-phosphate decarboxylase
MQAAINPIICAMDFPSLAHTLGMVEQVGPYIGAVKLGLEFFVACGSGGVEQVAAMGLPVFLDLKLHDIPNTVAAAVRHIASLPIAMTTLHATCGSKALREAVAAAEEITRASELLLLGVTVLTSMDAESMSETGVQGSIAEQVMRLAELSVAAGCNGLVCSAHELVVLRQRFGRAVTLVVPGIRPLGSAVQDQARTMTPAEAMAAGANYLVIGRPITHATSPVDAAKNIMMNLSTSSS